MYDPSSNSYFVSKDKALDIVSSREKEYRTNGAKALGAVGGIVGAGIGLAKGGVSGAAAGLVVGAGLGSIVGRSMGNAGNKQLREDPTYLSNQAKMYMGRKYPRGFSSKVTIE